MISLSCGHLPAAVADNDDALANLHHQKLLLGRNDQPRKHLHRPAGAAARRRWGNTSSPPSRIAKISPSTMLQRQTTRPTSSWLAGETFTVCRWQGRSRAGGVPGPGKSVRCSYFPCGTSVGWVDCAKRRCADEQHAQHHRQVSTTPTHVHPHPRSLVARELPASKLAG